MADTQESAPIFYPDLGDLSTPEPGNAEGLTLKPYEHARRPQASDQDGKQETVQSNGRA